MGNVQPIPEGYAAVTPYLTVQGAEAALKFYQAAFGGEEGLRLEMPDGKLGHAEIKIGDSVIMLSDEFPDMDMPSPHRLGGTAVSLHLYVSDVDAVFQQAIAAGASEIEPVKDQFYGDRTGKLKDPFGHIWTVATHIEAVPLAEVKRRLGELYT